MPRSDKLTKAHLHALKTLRDFPLGSPEIEGIELDAGNDCIKRGLVELSCPLIGIMRFQLTPAGRALLDKEGK